MMKSRTLLRCFQLFFLYTLIAISVDAKRTRQRWAAHPKLFRHQRHGNSAFRQKRPTDLRQLCSVRRGSVKCNVPAGEELHFSSIEYLAKFQRFKNLKLVVICEQGGVLVAAWPLKAEKLRKMYVKGCLLREWFSQQFNKELDKEPDFLKDVRIIDSQIETDILDVLKVTLNMSNSSKSTFCGPQTLRTQVIRNMTYVFRKIPNQQEILVNSGILNTLPDQFQNPENLPYTCVYEDLEYLDESIKKSRSKFSFDLLVASSRFPKLKQYNISSNILPRIPEKLNSWSHVFPVLEYLDLSNNRIENITIEPFSNPEQRAKPLIVDLRRNQIKTFPKELSGACKTTPAIIFDLRENPHVCDCKIKYLQEYLTSLPSAYSHMDAACHDPISFQGLSVQSQTVKDFVKNSCN